MARSIVQKHGLNEKQAADLLGLSQSAISRYVGRERGSGLVAIESTAEVLALIDQMVTVLIQEPQNKTRVLELFCQTCSVIRQKGLMCPKCREQMPLEWAEKCFFCADH
jgi:predicted transcriptional regulator